MDSAKDETVCSSKIFYHIHNPKPNELLCFTKAYPNYKQIYLVRNPIQALESGMTNQLGDGYSQKSWLAAATKFDYMIRELMSPLPRDNTVGIRLEDVKREPKKTMKMISTYLDIY